MKRFLSFITVGLCVITLACSEKKNKPVQDDSSLPIAARNYLLAHGFKQSTGPDIYEMEHVRLSDAARYLGFPISELRHNYQQEVCDSDMRNVRVETYIIVAGEFPERPENQVINSYKPLDNPDSFCKAKVFLNGIRKYYEPTDSFPKLNIKSITPTKDPSKPMQITFEISADGTMPVVIPQDNLRIVIRRKGKSDYQLRTHVSFPAGTPKFITVNPNKPVTLTGYPIVEEYFEKQIISGEYIIQMTLNNDMKDGPTTDYEWDNLYLSNKFKSESHNVTIE
jgi:hypothetical protein